MKKISSILIFLAVFAILGISAESFAKNRTIFSSQANQPTTIEEYRAEYDALDGPPYKGGGRGDSLEDARISVENLRAKIADYRKIFGTGDQTGTGFPGKGNGPQGTPTGHEAGMLNMETARPEIERIKKEYLAFGGSASEGKGTYDYPHTPNVNDKAPTLSEAQALIAPFAPFKIAELKTEYKARGGLESEGIGSGPGGTPTLSEAQALVQQILTEIANYRKIFGSGEQTGTPIIGTGSGPERTTTRKQARSLYNEISREIAELKKEFLDGGGSASEGKGNYDDPATLGVVENTPTYQEAFKLRTVMFFIKHRNHRASVQLLKSESTKKLIIGLTGGIGGALLLGGGLGLGYGFYRRRKKLVFS